MKNQRCTRTVGMLALILIFLFTASNGLAADFPLEWDPNCNDEPNLIGYNIYYKEGSSILANSDDAVLIYVPLSEDGFAPEQPSYEVKGLKDDTRYYFVVTAMYDDNESSMSNEIVATNGSSSPTANISSSGSSSGSGPDASCFIYTLL